jgi:hypothetical protein
MNCIHLSRPDYPAISSSAMVPTFIPDALEHNLPQVGENVGMIVEYLLAGRLVRKVEGKGDKLLIIMHELSHSIKIEYATKAFDN